jgi:toxin YoeB
MQYKINLDKKAQKQLEIIKKDKKLLAKVLEIFDEICKDPYSPTHKFERLRYNLSGFCSKRLDAKNRILYRVVEDEVIVLIISIWGHYEGQGKH